ncbi:hypothetical protein QE152_g5100 [Popillia japonica]|uniref:Uncharacterized protein n=1 Tax=Popillia japonica TaxID=7064 RepID=A0AAW1MQ33_POPJA
MQSGSIKVLGLHVDSKLSWSAHIHETAKKFRVAVFSIRRIQDVATYDATRITYFVNFHSIAMNGLQFWRMAAEAIFKLQKRALSILCGLEIRQSCK